MKYWECINVPGKTNVEGATTIAPSVDVVGVDNVEIVDVGYSAEMSSEKYPSFSDSYLNIVQSTLGISVESNNNIYKYATPDSPKTPAEEDALKYISADDVDYSAYNVSVTETDSSTYDAGDVSTTVPDITTGEDNKIIDVPVDEVISSIPEATPSQINASDILSGIFANSSSLDAIAESVADRVVEKVIEPPEPEFALTDEQFEDIVETLNKYEADYFSDIPIAHISKRFLKNITKEIYKAHVAATVKYEAPPLMDPVFLLYPLTTEDPYMALGKFWSIFMDYALAPGDSGWCDIIDKSAKEYDEYIKDISEVDDDELNDK